jgi:hypothetical protein
MMTSFNFENQLNESLNSEVNQNKLEINSLKQHQDNQIEGIHSRNCN